MGSCEILTKEIYDDARALHEKSTNILQDLKTKYIAGLTLEETADTLFMLREIEEFCKDIKSQATAVKDLGGRIACTLAVADGSLNIPKGQLATARISGSTAIQLPSRTKEPEAYTEICEALGIADSPFTRPHFPAVKDWLSEKIANGENIPKPLEKYANYATNSVVTRRIATQA